MQVAIVAHHLITTSTHNNGCSKYITSDICLQYGVIKLTKQNLTKKRRCKLRSPSADINGHLTHTAVSAVNKDKGTG